MTARLQAGLNPAIASRLPLNRTARQRGQMKFTLLMSWMELGALLAILFRLGHTFELIANTQRELRQAIHHLGESRNNQLPTESPLAATEIPVVSRPLFHTPVPRTR
jgi:hypothetical protein